MWFLNAALCPVCQGAYKPSGISKPLEGEGGMEVESLLNGLKDSLLGHVIIAL